MFWISCADAVNWVVGLPAIVIYDLRSSLFSNWRSEHSQFLVGISWAGCVKLSISTDGHSGGCGCSWFDLLQTYKCPESKDRVQSTSNWMHHQSRHCTKWKCVGRKMDSSLQKYNLTAKIRIVNKLKSWDLKPARWKRFPNIRYQKWHDKI